MRTILRYTEKVVRMALADAAQSMGEFEWVIGLADVLSRNKLAGKLLEQRVTPAFLMQHYGMLAKVVTPAIIGRVVPDDADDDAVLACALAAQAKLIVSGDADLLVLKQFQNMRIVTAAQAVKIITVTA